MAAQGYSRGDFTLSLVMVRAKCVTMGFPRVELSQSLVRGIPFDKAHVYTVQLHGVFWRGINQRVQGLEEGALYLTKIMMINRQSPQSVDALG